MTYEQKAKEWIGKDIDIYGAHLVLDFARFLDSEKPAPTLDELKKEMNENYVSPERYLDHAYALGQKEAQPDYVRCSECGREGTKVGGWAHLCPGKTGSGGSTPTQDKPKKIEDIGEFSEKWSIQIMWNKIRELSVAFNKANNL